MKLVAFEEIQQNTFFWLYFLSTSFPLAMDTQEDIGLSDFIYENYDCVSEASEWVDTFVQYSDDVMEEHDGHAENPTSVMLSVEGTEYIIQYHPGDTLYLRNGQTIASTGPHYQIHKLDFQQFLAITKEIDVFQKALLLLPIVAVTASEAEPAKELIMQFIQKSPVSPEHHHQIADMIVEGLRV